MSVKIERVLLATVQHDLSWLQRYVVRRFHPRCIFIDTVGFIWFVYYFWDHDWRTALGAALLARVIAVMSVLNVDTSAFAETVLGRIALLHLNPMNLVTQTLGLLAFLYGLWQHSTVIILVGVSLVLLGHIAGWSGVDSRMSDQGT